MRVAGTGVVFPGGAGMDSLREALLAGVPAKGLPLEEGKPPALKVPSSVFRGNPVLAPARRADRFSKMSLLAAMEALDGSTADTRRTGIILATALGPHGTVFRFVNEMLEYGHPKASPTVFSQSVHAAAASMISVAAKLTGPALSVADLAFPFEEALMLADAWLESDRCDAVLVGAVEEVTDILAYIAQRKWPLSTDGDREVMSNGEVCVPPGEGAVFFRMERGAGSQVSVQEDVSSSSACHLFNAGALGGNEAELLDLVVPTIPAYCYTPLWGSTRIGAAFHLAAATVMQEEKSIFQGLKLSSGHASGNGPDAGTLAGEVQIVSVCRGRCRSVTLC